MRHRAVWTTAVAGCLAVAMVVAYFLLPLDLLGPDHPAVGWTMFVLALVVVAAVLLWEVHAVLTSRRAARPGMIIPLLILLSILVFSAGYYVLAKRPGELIGLRTRLDALYFTVVTLATVGYGDITPSGQAARLVDIVQILYNFVFLTAGATSFTKWLRGEVSRRRDQPG